MGKPPDFTGSTAWFLCMLVSIIFAGSVVADDTLCRSSDVERMSHDCMTDFYTQLDALRVTGHKFFTGVDAEMIRSVCSWFHAALSCLRNVRDQCPRSAAFMDSLIEPHESLEELCSFPEFYENYAMRQNCFHRVRSQSDSCWTQFRSVTADLISEISSTGSVRSGDRRRQAALPVFCSHLRHLQTCVKSAVHNACKKLAANLVDVLVRASVELSPRCTASDVTSHVTVTPVSPATRQNGAYKQHHGERHHGDNIHSTSGGTATTYLCFSSLHWRLVWASLTAVCLSMFVNRSCCSHPARYSVS